MFGIFLGGMEEKREDDGETEGREGEAVCPQGKRIKIDQEHRKKQGEIRRLRRWTQILVPFWSLVTRGEKR